MTPQEIRQRMVASYLDSYRRAGISVTTEQVERQVVADCELVDAARRAGDIGKPAPKPEPAPRRSDPIAEAQRSTGTRLSKGAQQYDRFGFLHGNPQAMSERWGAACARIRRILQGAGKSSSVTGAVNGSEHPELARQYMETYWYFMTRGKPAPIVGLDHNPFRGLRDADAARLFMRLVEDICDRSTGVLGGWYATVSEVGRAR